MKTITSFKIAGLITACLFCSYAYKSGHRSYFFSKHRLPV